MASVRLDLGLITLQIASSTSHGPRLLGALCASVALLAAGNVEGVGR